MFLKIGLFLGAPFLLLAIAVGFTGVALIDVQERDGMHLIIPVPMILAQTALAVVPAEKTYVECPEFAEYVDIAAKVAEELRGAPDFLMVDLTDGNERVLVRKERNDFIIEANDGQETVFCRIPIKGVQKMLDAYDGRGFPATAALAAFRSARRGEIVHVQDGEDEVRISRLF